MIFIIVLRIYIIPHRNRRTRSAEIDELRRSLYGNFARQTHYLLFLPSMTIDLKSIDLDYSNFPFLHFHVAVDPPLSSITHICLPARFYCRNICLFDNHPRQN